MKLYLSGRTTGIYGGFAKNLPYFNSYIENYLQLCDFQSTFEEMWVTFAFPPTYVRKGILGMKKEYEEWYSTFNFPYSRLNRRYKKIDLLLKTPEFSESFEFIDKEDEIIRLEIEEKYKGIPRVEIAVLMIDYLIYAGEVVKTKLKKDDIFDFERYRQILIEIKGKISDDFLDTISVSEDEKYQEEKLKSALKERENRRSSIRNKDKVIRDIRIYYKEEHIPKNGLYPIEYQYVEIFLNLLQKYRFSTPTYHHLYIQVAPTNEEAFIEMLPQIEDWYIFGVSTFNYKTYQNSDDKIKEEMIFNMIYHGLLDIVEVDNLDLELFQKVVNEIKIKGLDTELTFTTIENERYKLVVTYLSKSREEQCPIYFTLTDKKSNLSSRKEIGKADKSQIYYWLQKITLTRNSIKIQSGNSSWANAWLENKPRFLEFQYSDFDFS
jgi:hypothetical protein